MFFFKQIYFRFSRATQSLSMRLSSSMDLGKAQSVHIYEWLPPAAISPQQQLNYGTET